MFDLGDTWALTADVRNPANVLTNGDTAVLTITLPDGTTATPTVTNPPALTGRYTSDHVPAAAGRHVARWVFTFPDGSSAAYTETIYVDGAAPLGIVSLTEAKQHLNITGTADDEELRSWIESVTELVEGDPEFGVGPVVVRSHSERVTDGPCWWLTYSPALSLTSVTKVLIAGTTVTTPELDLHTEWGKVVRLDGMWHRGGPWTVVYKAGRATIPGNIRRAALIILKHMWETQRGGPKRPTRGGEDAGPTGSSYVIPNRARELLAPHRRGPRLG